MDKRLDEAVQLQLHGQIEQAKAIYQEIMKDNPMEANAPHLLGVIRNQEGETHEAIRLMAQAIELKPDGAIFHHNMAGILGHVGELESAADHFRRAIELDPTRGEPYQGLTEIEALPEDDPILEQAKQQIFASNSPESQTCLFFALGKIYDELGQYDRAFSHFTSGNKWADRKFDSEAFKQRVKDTIYTYNPYRISNFIGLGGAHVPVFIVGMPRSGSTLIEQILASHSKVHAAGELPHMEFASQLARDYSDFHAPFPNCIPYLSQRALDEITEYYIDQTPWYKGKITHVVDKHPLNFQYIGLILEMFPYAKIIHSTRDPMDMILSCFFQNFTKGMDFSFNLIQLAHFYVNYRRLMWHWETLYPHQILEVMYEDIVHHQESTSRGIISFCGLGWEEQCLRPHETERIVRTASFAQVKEPIYKRSIGRWDNYEKQLRNIKAIIE